MLGPRLVGLNGAGLVAAGVFVPDPALGFPPGTPDEIPSHFSWHAVLHAVTPPLAFLALITACLVLARHAAGLGRRRWRAYSRATAALALLLSAWPGVNGSGVRLAVALALGFAWVLVLPLRLLGGDAGLQTDSRTSSLTSKLA